MGSWTKGNPEMLPNWRCSNCLKQMKCDIQMVILLRELLVDFSNFSDFSNIFYRQHCVNLTVGTDENGRFCRLKIPLESSSISSIYSNTSRFCRRQSDAEDFVNRTLRISLINDYNRTLLLIWSKCHLWTTVCAVRCPKYVSVCALWMQFKLVNVSNRIDLNHCLWSLL